MNAQVFIFHFLQSHSIGWLGLGCLTVVGSGFLFFVHGRRRFLRRCQEEMERKAQEQNRSLEKALAEVAQYREMAEACLKEKLNAEAVSKSTSEFLASMSHEIRTPMNAVLGFAGLALKQELDPKVRDYVQKISNAGQSMLGILNDIMDFSKIEAGKLELERVPFRLGDVLIQIADLFAQKTAEKDLEWIVGASPNVPDHLNGDPLRLSQVLVNLVGNAVKFTNQGFIRVRVSLDSSAEAGEDEEPRKLRLCFSVQDSGIGMDPDQQDRLFQAFSQADASTSRQFGGTGLGLAISQRLVELMGGVIRVESEPGRGSLFSFDAEFGREDVPHSTSARISRSACDRHVLVVDDSPEARELLMEHLLVFGFEGRAVDSGMAALKELQRRHFDLVIMDFKMPGMNGLETARHIKSDPRLATIPEVIMISSFGSEDVLKAAVDAGIAAFLHKPVNPTTLLETIHHVMGGESHLSPSEPQQSVVSGTQSALQGACVLLVEDNVINQQIGSEVLKQAGVHVEIANDGLEALRMVDQKAYDAVLMDIQMPGMDGYQATLSIREKNRHASLPIIAMTAHAMAGYREECLMAGMNDYVTKPINAGELFKVLAKWIQPEQLRKNR